jgi:hypothetical protein
VAILKGLLFLKTETLGEVWRVNMYAWIVLLIVLIILALSTWQRINYFRKTLDPMNSKVSPLSLAIQELVAMSGSIYLSLVMLVSFLKLSLPDTVLIYTVHIDPLALLAISLAIIQPLFLTLFSMVKKE